MNYERAQNDFVGLYAPNLIFHSIFTPPIKMEPTFIQNPNSSSDDSFNDDTSQAIASSPTPSTYTTMVRINNSCRLLIIPRNSDFIFTTLNLYLFKIKKFTIKLMIILPGFI